MFVVTPSNNSDYTFIQKENGEYLNENLYFTGYNNINDNICVVQFISEDYHFIKKSDGTIVDDLPIFTNIISFNTSAKNEFAILEFFNNSDINRAVLRKSDCTISPLYYDIKDFNSTYFAAYFDRNTLTLMKKSDYSLLCNYFSVHKGNITAYPESDYFSIKKDGKLYLYK